MSPGGVRRGRIFPSTASGCWWTSRPGRPTSRADGFKITKTPPLLLEALQSFFEITKLNYSREVRTSKSCQNTEAQ